MEVASLRSELSQLQSENTALRNTLLALHSELYGAKLAAKYLDKELAGRWFTFHFYICHNNIEQISLHCRVFVCARVCMQSNLILKYLLMYSSVSEVTGHGLDTRVHFSNQLHVHNGSDTHLATLQARKDFIV
jgi:hypothetical protein